MQDIIAVVIFLIAFTALMIVIYRIIGEDVHKVHGCHAGGMKVEKEESSKVA
jgi:hypothetical protein